MKQRCAYCILAVAQYIFPQLWPMDVLFVHAISFSVTNGEKIQIFISNQNCAYCILAFFHLPSSFWKVSVTFSDTPTCTSLQYAVFF